MKVGIFDSGIGGLSVLYQALQYLEDVQFIYYADTKNVPYGEKTKEQVIGYVDQIIQFMIDKGAQAVVIACNTATSAAVNLMREKYSIPIIGMEPAAKKALDLYGDKKVLVCATKITVEGQKMLELEEKFDKDHLVRKIALPGLVHFAEKLDFHSQDVYDYLKKELENYDLNEYGSIVLGCTHFIYFKDVLRDIIPAHVHLVDGNEGTIRQLSKYIEHLSDEQSVEYYFSGRKANQEDLHKIQCYMDRLDQMLHIQ